MKKAKDLGKKNEGKVYKKPSVKKETVKKYVENFKLERAAYIKEIKYEKEIFNEDIEIFDFTDKYTNVMI